MWQSPGLLVAILGEEELLGDKATADEGSVYVMARDQFLRMLFEDSKLARPDAFPLDFLQITSISLNPFQLDF